MLLRMVQENTCCRFVETLGIVAKCQFLTFRKDLIMFSNKSYFLSNGLTNKLKTKKAHRSAPSTITI